MTDTLVKAATAAADDAAQNDSGQTKGLLRFLTCGSVDDGKSTLIGRLLYDSKLIFEDQLATLERDSKKHGTVGEDIDLALLVDGLEAERQQGITIDVAYRFFTTPNRAEIGMETRLLNPSFSANVENSSTMASKTSSEKPTRSILLTARMTWRMPSNEAM